MAKFVGILLCFALIHTSYALKCYNCVSSTGDKNCDDISDPSKVKTAECGKAAGANMIPACIKKVVEDKKTMAVNTTRSCIIMRSESTESECKGNNAFNVLSCDVCKDDLCNGSLSLTFSAAAMLGSVATFLLARYMN